jgi:signal transduction histidine kinase
LRLSNVNKTFIVIPIVLVSSIILAILSYNYFTQTANQIQDLAIDDLQTNSEIEAYSISNSLSNAISAITSNLILIANSPSVIEGNISRIQTLLNAGLDSTRNLTDGYYFLDSNGRLAAFTGIEREENTNYKDIDLSHRDYFQIPKQNGTMYISTVIDSNDNIPRLFISFPVLENNRSLLLNSTEPEPEGEVTQSSNRNLMTFKGVVVASIETQNLGNFLESEIHPKFNSDIAFMDRNATIIYTQNQTFIGKNYFGNDFQSYIKAILKDKVSEFNTIINKSLLLKSGLDEFNFENTSTTIAYEAVEGPDINVNGESDNRIGTLFITVPHTLVGDVASLIDNQTITNFSIIGIIVGISTIISLLLLRWNSVLKAQVYQKTTELRETIEKLRKANEELKSHDKMQREFINIAAHELRTPTQGITGNLELIEMIHIPSLFQDFSKDLEIIEQELDRIAKDNNNLRSFIGGLVSIYRNAKRLEKLVNDILDTSRIESNRLELHKESFNLNIKIHNVIKDVHSKINLISAHSKQSKQVNISFEPKEDPINVLADKVRIFEVISNLINNAIKFSNGQTITISCKKMLKKEIKAYLRHHPPPHNQKEGSTVNIENKDDDDTMMMAVVSIRDKGKGIDPDILPRLFTKFTTKSDQGTGLGLYIAKSIVEAHGGQIWAQNNFDKYKGATFSFSLPLDIDLND